MKLMMLTQLKSYWFVVEINIVYTKGVIRSRRTGNTMVKTKGTKRQTSALKGYIAPASIVVPAVLLRKEMDCDYAKRNMFVVICYTDIRSD